MNQNGLRSRAEPITTNTAYQERRRTESTQLIPERVRQKRAGANTYPNNCSKKTRPSEERLLNRG